MDRLGQSMTLPHDGRLFRHHVPYEKMRWKQACGRAERGHPRRGQADDPVDDHGLEALHDTFQLCRGQHGPVYETHYEPYEETTGQVDRESAQGKGIAKSRREASETR